MTTEAGISDRDVEAARRTLDEWVKEVVEWHFNPETGCQFWLEWAEKAGWEPRKEVRSFDDLTKFPQFEDEWLRGGPVRRWVPRGLADKPVYVFETGGTTGIPKSRVAMDDFRTDYELFSETLPEEHFPRGSNWLMLGPSGPRRLRLAVEHLAHFRGGICFCVDLDPRWVIKLIKKGWTGPPEGLSGARDRSGAHRAVGRPRHQVPVLDAKADRGACEIAWRPTAPVSRKRGITGIFAGGTEFTPQWNRFAHEELLDGVYMTPTYGNTLMGSGRESPKRGRRRVQDYLLCSPSLALCCRSSTRKSRMG